MSEVTVREKPTLTTFEAETRFYIGDAEEAPPAIMHASGVEIEKALKALLAEVVSQGLTPDWDSLRIRYEFDGRYVADTFKVHLTAGRE